MFSTYYHIGHLYNDLHTQERFQTDGQQTSYLSQFLVGTANKNDIKLRLAEIRNQKNTTISLSRTVSPQPLRPALLIRDFTLSYYHKSETTSHHIIVPYHY